MRKIDRFDEYLKIKGLNDNKVTSLLDLSVGTLGKSRKEGRDLSANVIEKILNYFNDLDSRWLLTGEGEMLKVNATADSFQHAVAEPSFSYGSQHISGNGNCNNTNGSRDTNVITALLSQLNVKDEQIKEQSVQIDRLLKIIEKMQ